MKKNYLKEMVGSGYAASHIDDFHRLVMPYLGERFFPDKHARILDIGAGSGHGLLPLRERGWKNLWAADIDDFNKQVFEKAGIHFNRVDVENNALPFADNFFDAVISFHLIEHLRDPARYLEEAYRVLSPGAPFLVVTPDWRKQYKTFWRDHTHVHPYDKESIARLLRSFEFDPIAVKSFGVMRGVGRTGIWKRFKPLMFTGVDMICISKKK